MKILVTAKRVTDPDMKIKIKSDGSGIALDSMSFKVNPFDEIAIEEALRIREDKGGEGMTAAVTARERASGRECRPDPAPPCRSRHQCLHRGC